MSRHPRNPVLTEAHIALIRREVADSGPLPGFRPLTDAEFTGWAADLASRDPDPDGPLRIFAYGSLIWKPEARHEAEEDAVLNGWHRSFCLWMPRYRGTPELPGFMMAADRGGACRGIVLTLERGDKTALIARHLRREAPMTPTANLARWVWPQTARGRVPALVFVANRASPRYAGRLDPSVVALALARACGYGGTSAEYLLHTLTHLEARGIRDAMLWQLQRLVAERIEADQAASQTPDGA